LNAWTNLYETWYVYHGNWAHLKGSPSHQSLCLYVYPPIVARQLLGKGYRGNEYTNNNRRIVGHVVFYAVRVV
jgi:hypothetical protein